jgi:methylthioxylose transferase
MSRRRLALVASVMLAAVAIVGYGSIEAERYEKVEIKIRLGFGPLVGERDVRFGWRTLPVVLLAAVVVVWGPRAARWMSWRWMAAATSLTTALFTVALAATDTKALLLEPVVDKTEYWQALATAPPAGEFVDTFVERIQGYSVHLRGHPPGFTALLLVGRAVGITSPWAVAALSWVCAGLAAGAVVISVGRLAGHSAARAVAPFLCVAPYAIWAGTSADAVYMALAAGGVCCLTIAATGEHSMRRRWAWSVLSGLLFGLLLFGTYGGAMVGPIALAVIIATRRWTLIAPVVLAIGVVVALWAWAGFWWFDGFFATKQQYWWGTAQFREPKRFAVFNIAALLIAVGPAVAVSLGLLKRARWAWFVGAALVSVAISNASQYTKGEVERIWLLFMPWLTIAAVALAARRRIAQAALAAQAATAIVLQTVLVSKW